MVYKGQEESAFIKFGGSDVAEVGHLKQLYVGNEGEEGVVTIKAEYKPENAVQERLLENEDIASIFVGKDETRRKVGIVKDYNASFEVMYEEGTAVFELNAHLQTF